MTEKYVFSFREEFGFGVFCLNCIIEDFSGKNDRLNIRNRCTGLSFQM